MNAMASIGLPAPDVCDFL